MAVMKIAAIAFLQEEDVSDLFGQHINRLMQSAD